MCLSVGMFVFVCVFRCFIFDIGKHLCHICILRHRQLRAHPNTHTLMHWRTMPSLYNTCFCPYTHIHLNANIYNSISLPTHVFVCVWSSAIINYFGEFHLIGLKLILLTCTLPPTQLIRFVGKLLSGWHYFNLRAIDLSDVNNGVGYLKVN